MDISRCWQRFCSQRGAFIHSDLISYLEILQCILCALYSNVPWFLSDIKITCNTLWYNIMFNCIVNEFMTYLWSPPDVHFSINPCSFLCYSIITLSLLLTTACLTWSWTSYVLCPVTSLQSGVYLICQIKNIIMFQPF